MLKTRTCFVSTLVCKSESGVVLGTEIRPLLQVSSERLEQSGISPDSPCGSYPSIPSIEPRCEKTGLRGFRPGPTQTGLCSHRRLPEA